MFLEDKLNQFWHWISERQKVFYRRKVRRSAPPWTDDPIIAAHHFTNVYRELDPGTTWVLRNILEVTHVPASDRAFLTMAYRLFGTEEVFSLLGVGRGLTHGHPMLPGSFDRRWLADALQGLMDQGVQAFTSAYMVSNYGRPEPKSVVISDILHDAAQGWEATWRDLAASDTRQEAFNALQRVHGIGPFLAFQTLVDLCYPLRTQGEEGGILPFHNNDWVKAGPGALRGLEILTGGRIGASQDDALIAKLVRLQKHPLEERGMPWLLDDRNRKVLVDRSNMQNCLCEFSKYHKLWRAAGGTVRGRRRSFDHAEAAARDRARPQERQLLTSRYAIQGDMFL